MNWVVVVRKFDGEAVSKGFSSLADARQFRDDALMDDDVDGRWEIEDAIIYEKTGF